MKQNRESKNINIVRTSAVFGCCQLLGLRIPLFQDYPESLISKAGHLIAKYSYGVSLSNLPITSFGFVKLMFLPIFICWAVVIPLRVGLPVALCHSIEGPLISRRQTMAESLSRKMEKLSAGVAEKAASVV